jgi:hypothetical protein
MSPLGEVNYRKKMSPPHKILEALDSKPLVLAGKRDSHVKPKQEDMGVTLSRVCGYRLR